MAQSQKVLALDASYVPAHVLLGRAYLQQGLNQDAIAEFRQALQLSGGDTNDLAALGYAQARAGQPGEARKALEELETRSRDTYVQPMWMAAIDLALGEKNEAFDGFEKAYADRSAWLVDLKVDPFFDSIRSDPHFTDLLRRVGLSGGAQ